MNKKPVLSKQLSESPLYSNSLRSRLNLPTVNDNSSRAPSSLNSFSSELLKPFENQNSYSSEFDFLDSAHFSGTLINDLDFGQSKNNPEEKILVRTYKQNYIDKKNYLIFKNSLVKPLPPLVTERSTILTRSSNNSTQLSNLIHNKNNEGDNYNISKETLNKSEFFLPRLKNLDGNSFENSFDIIEGIVRSYRSNFEEKKNFSQRKVINSPRKPKEVISYLPKSGIPTTERAQSFDQVSLAETSQPRPFTEIADFDDTYLGVYDNFLLTEHPNHQDYLVVSPRTYKSNFEERKSFQAQNNARFTSFFDETE
jgi:hypothetical protein